MYSGDNFGIAKVGNELKPYRKYYTSADYTPWMHSSDFNEAKKMVKDLPPCVYGSPVIDLLNSFAMRAALHIPDDVQAWSYCTDKPGWTYDRGDIASYKIWEDFITEKVDLRALFYSGDTDGSVPTYGTLQWIDALGW